MNDIGERIRQLRLASTLRPEQYARVIGVSRVALQKWESGLTANVKLHNLVAICDFHAVTMDELVRGKKGGFEDALLRNRENPWPFTVPRQHFDALPARLKAEASSFIEYLVLKSHGSTSGI